MFRIVFAFALASVCAHAASQREVAEWVIRWEGRVILEGSRQPITELSQIPAGEFTITGIDLTGAVMLPAELEILISQYAEGTLPAEGRDALEEVLRRDPAARALLEEYRGLDRANRSRYLWLTSTQSLYSSYMAFCLSVSGMFILSRVILLRVPVTFNPSVS